MEPLDGRAVRAMALEGDSKEAFELFWNAFYRRLCVFAASFRGVPASEREDEVAETLIAAFGALEGFDPEKPLAPWVYAIARNRFASAARRASRVTSVVVGQGEEDEAAIDPPSDVDVAASAAELDLVDRCRAAVRRLPETDRRIALLCFYEGMNSTEAGRALGLASGTVRWRLMGIRKFIKAAVGEGEL